MLGLNKKITGNISSLPINISKLSIILEKFEKVEKFPTGPTIFPRPGPTFPSVVNTAVTFVSKSKLSKVTNKIDTTLIKQ